MHKGSCECGAVTCELDGENATSVGTGTLDGATRLETAAHTYVADMGDYYAIEAGPKQRDQ